MEISGKWTKRTYKIVRINTLPQLSAKKMFGPKRNVLPGDWRRMRAEELRCSSPHNLQVNSSRRMERLEHVARMGKKRNLTEGDHMGNIGVDVRAILRGLFEKLGPGERSRYRDSLRAGRSEDRSPVGGEIFRTSPDRPWSIPSFLCNEYRVFPGGNAAGAWC